MAATAILLSQDDPDPKGPGTPTRPAGPGALPRADLEEQVGAKVAELPGYDAPDQVICEGDLPAETGAVQYCEVQLPTDTGWVQTVVSGVQDGRPSFDITPYLPPEEVNGLIEEDAAGQGYEITVSCTEPLTGEPGFSIDCPIDPTDVGSKVVVTVTSAEGLAVYFDWRSEV